MRLSILHLIAPGEAGGLERVVQLLAAGHARAGHEVGVAAVLDAPRREHPLLESLREAGVRVFPCPVSTRAYLQERRAVGAVIRETRPDVVHTHGYRVDVVDGGVPLRLGIPTVTTVHGFTGGDWKNRSYEWLQCRAFRRFHGVVAVSRPLREQLLGRGVPRERLHLLRNAWAGEEPPLERAEARRVLGIAPHEWVIGWVGRLSEEKGADVLVEALARVPGLAPTAVVIGAGRERDALTTRARVLGVGGHIRWAGLVPDAGRLFRAFDLFVLSSRTEGTPMVLFEAMSAQVPIVATRVGGVPDVVSEAEAVLVPADDPAALAAGIEAVRADPRSARARAAAALRRLQGEFCLEPWLAHYETLYRAVQPSPRLPGRS